MEPTSPLLTIKDTAAVLAVSPRTVARLVASGELESVRIRGARRIPPAALKRYVDSRQREHREKAVGF